MEKNKSLYWTLFTSTLTLSTFTFGGGYVIASMMEKKFVHELNWIEQDDILDLIAIAQSAPGSLAMNTAIILGYHVAGVQGALIASIGTVLPPLFIMIGVSYAYTAFRDNMIVNNLLLGMQAGVAAIIVNVVFNLAKKVVLQKKVLPIFVMVVSLIAGIVFDVNILYLLFFSGLIGAASSVRDLISQRKKSKDEEVPKK